MTDHDDAMRTIVELPDAQIKALARLCQREGISRAEAIRRAVEKLVRPDEAETARENLRGGFGLWRGRPLDGRGHVETMRAEWDDQRGGETGV